MLKFGCKFCENLSEKMYALNHSGGNTRYGASSAHEADERQRGLVPQGVIHPSLTSAGNPCIHPWGANHRQLKSILQLLLFFAEMRQDI